MFSQILYTQWKWTRYGLIPLVLIAFAIPTMSVGSITILSIWTPGELGLALMRNSSHASWLYLISATLTGLIMALSSWYWDDRGNHMYALSLPVPRWRYSLQRMSCGALLLVLPTLGVWVGGLVAAASLSIPEPVQAYSGALAIRYYLGSLLFFSIFFTLAAGTIRTALIAISIVPGIIFLQTVASAVGFNVDIVGSVFSAIVNWPGPFEVLRGPWMLFDV